ncbi:MAG: ABC transporter ATP-binding protein [Pigmentiphaga sp.]
MNAVLEPKGAATQAEEAVFPPMFVMDDIGFSYAASGQAGAKIIDGASLELGRGEFVCILGPSGCGKSTLLTIAAGLTPCQSGTVRIAGETTTNLPGKAGFMMQRDELLPWRTVMENVLLGPEIINGKITAEDRRRADELLGVAGIRAFQDHYPSALSGGMRQRAAFVRTLMLNRPLVLLDEPFGALDAITRAEMQAWLLEMQAELKLTLLMVTHDVDEAIFLSDRVLVMSSRPGRISLVEPVDFPRPRNYEAMVALPQFGALKSRLLHAIRS